MRRVIAGLASLALLFVCSASLVAERPGPGTLDGYVHDITNPLSEAPGRTFGLFPADDPTGAAPVVLVPGEHALELAAVLGRHVLVRGNWLEAPPEIDTRRFVVEGLFLLDDGRLARTLRDDLAARGDVFGDLGTETPGGGFDADRLLCPSGAPARAVPLYVPPPETADEFTDTAYVCDDTGSYWALRTGGIAGITRWVGPFDVPDHDPGLRDALLADIESRGPNVFFEEGTSTPGGGLDPKSPKCPGGEPARVLVLLDAPPGTADGFTETAYVCAGTRVFWARLQGGIAGFDLWIGPFALPEHALDAPRSENAPTRVIPRVLRTGRHDRTRRVTVKRRVLDDDAAPLDTSRYATGDFDLGHGVDVLRVLRVRRNRVRLRVLIEAHAQTGARPVRVLGRAGDATLRIR